MKHALEQYLYLTLVAQLSLLLVVAVFLWSIGAPLFFGRAHAASLTQVSDVLSYSGLGSPSGHYITFTSNAQVVAGQTIVYQLDPVTSAFTEAFDPATSTNFSVRVGSTTYQVVNTCTAGPQFSAIGNYNNGTNENLQLTLCPTNNIPATTTIALSVATTTASTKAWTNPSSAGSYRILIGGTQPNSGETRVVALPVITLTASVNTSFTFTVTGLATSTSLFGQYATTTGSTTPTAIPFGTLASTTGNGSTTLAQLLNVTTNARNGFVVTVQENQPPTSSTGATIDLFKNGATTSIPELWAAPSAQLDVPSTYGHFGVTSDDGDLNSDEFGNVPGTPSRWAGNIDVPRSVFSHTGPSDGTTQNKGKAIVGYRIQISDLQEAGTDYTNTLIYVATPTF
jgi:hypothetical protein